MTHQCSVAPVCERRDHQTPCVAQILVGVLDCGVGDPHQAVGILPVVAELSQPVEVVLCAHALKAGGGWRSLGGIMMQAYTNTHIHI